MYEGLEVRCFLSVSVEGEVLTVIGTKRDDVINVSLLADTAGSIIKVEFNGDKRRVSIGSDPLKLPRRIVIRSGKGNDKIRVSPIYHSGVRPVVVEAGAGNDVVTITNGLSIARVSGGSGDDVITAFSGRRDKLSGGSGNDLIQTYSTSGMAGDPGYLPRVGKGESEFHGSEGSIMSGGEGDDTLVGSALDDRLVGGPGKDVLFGDDGNDAKKGGPGNDCYMPEIGAIDDCLARKGKRPPP